MVFNPSNLTHKTKASVILKRYFVVMTGSLICLLLAAFGGPQQAVPEPTVISGAGDITAVVEEYRQVFGGQNNGGERGSFADGYREINWDSLPDELAVPNAYPSDFFNGPVAPRARGIVLVTPGEGLFVSADSDNSAGALPRFGNINPGYADSFKTFSEERLFSPVGSNIVEATFYVPGTNTPAVVRGFGAVYTDVDTEHTAFEYFDINGNSLGKFGTPIADAGLSFLGVAFPEPIVHRVRIAYGTDALGPDDSPETDVAVMDNFIYSEPQPVASVPATNAKSYIAKFDNGPASARIGLVVEDGKFAVYVCSLDDAFNLTTARWYTGELDAEGHAKGVSADGVELLSAVVNGDIFRGTVTNTAKETFTFTGAIVPAGSPAGLFRGIEQYGEGEVIVGAVLDIDGTFASTAQINGAIEFVSPISPEPVKLSANSLVVRIGTSAEPITVGRVTTLAPAIHPQIGWDNNFTGNSLVQPQDPALAGGGINQSLDFGDVLYGTSEADLLIGRLGLDVLLGNEGDDVLIGGLEHFHPQRSDRKFGGPGNDILIWGVGDGSDLLDGGPGEDVLILGLVGEVDDAGQTIFRLSNDEQAGQVFIDPVSQLPAVDVTNAPGFCGVIDDSSDANAPAQFESLGVQQLVRFFLRKQADAFEGGQQSDDNGLRQTMHIKDIEFLICPTRAGGAIEILDLTASPPTATELSALALNQRLQLIVR
ncbi:MAG: hypothetical protein DPW09_17870 [Anaerolineae bacterium]|nr:hypothetical protein [Anaerolineae bacterium]